MKRIDIIKEYLYSKTTGYLENGDYFSPGFDASQISYDLNLDRANVSKDLNTLWKNKLCVKKLGRPVEYFDINAIKDYFDIEFVPSTLELGESLGNLFNPKDKTTNNDNTFIDEFDLMVGAKDSLASQIQLAKAAINYPPYGLTILLIGEVGTGKWRFASYIKNYAFNHGIKTEDAKLIRIDCSSYSNYNSSFNLKLLGAIKGATAASSNHFIKGAIETSNNGFVYLDNVDKLNASYVDTLIEIIVNRNWSRIGESQSRELKCNLILATTDINSPNISSLEGHCPIQINLPNLEEREISEKIEIILNYISEEAKSIKYKIRFHKDILAILTGAKYTANTSGLQKEIRLICSKAYLRSKTSGVGIVEISHQDLSLQMLSSNFSNPEFHQISRLLNLLEGQYILVNEDGECSAIDFFHDLNNKFSEKRMKQFINEFTTDVETLNNIQDYCVENVSCLSNIGKVQKQALEKEIDPEITRIFANNVLQEKTKKVFQNRIQLMYGILLHITNLIHQGKDKNSLVINNEYLPKHNTSKLIQEYDDAKRIASKLYDRYSISLSENEINYIAQYFSVASNWNNNIHPGVLIISHGETIASSMYNFVTSLYPNISIAAIDYRDFLQLNDLLELATIKAHEIDSGAGVLIIADYEPLLSISSHLRVHENINSRTLSNLSVNLLLDCLQQINEGASIDQIAYFYSPRKENDAQNTIGNNTNFISKLTDEYFENSLTFLNPRKAVSALLTTLNEICTNLNLPITNQITVKFLYHNVNMLERVIAKNTLEYKDLKQFRKENSKMMRIIEKAFHPIEEIYGIHIPDSEYAYITEIFLLND